MLTLKVKLRFDKANSTAIHVAFPAVVDSLPLLVLEYDIYMSG